MEIKNDRCKIVKILIFRSLSREHSLSFLGNLQQKNKKQKKKKRAKQTKNPATREIFFTFRLWFSTFCDSFKIVKELFVVEVLCFYRLTWYIIK